MLPGSKTDVTRTVASTQWDSRIAAIAIHAKKTGAVPKAVIQDLLRHWIWWGTTANQEQQTVSNQRRKWKRSKFVLSFRLCGWPWQRLCGCNSQEWFLQNTWTKSQLLRQRLHGFIGYAFSMEIRKGKEYAHMKVHLLLNWSGRNTCEQIWRPFPKYKYTAVIQVQHALKIFNLTTLLHFETATVQWRNGERVKPPNGPMTAWWTSLVAAGTTHDPGTGFARLARANQADLVLSPFWFGVTSHAGCGHLCGMKVNRKKVGIDNSQRCYSEILVCTRMPMSGS